MCRLMHNKKRTAFWSEGFFSSLHTVVWLCLIKVYCSKILHCKISNLKTKLLPHVYQDVCAAGLFQHVQPHCLQSQGQVSSRSSASCQHQAHPRHLGLHSACLTPWHWLEGDKGPFLAHLRPEEPLTPVLLLTCLSSSCRQEGSKPGSYISPQTPTHVQFTLSWINAAVLFSQ